MISIPHLVEVSIILFLLFWLVGGVFFAIIALFRPAKLRKAQFSCLFSLSSLVLAIVAALFGTQLGAQEIEMCLMQADGYFASLAAVISCGVLPLTLVSLLAFMGLIALGFFFLLVSRSRNASWVDERGPEDAPLPGVQAPIVPEPEGASSQPLTE